MVSARKIIGMAFSVKRVLPALDRVVLSAISFVLALALRNVFSSLRYGLGVPPDPKGVFQSFWLGVLQMLWFGWPGLLLALPVVLFLPICEHGDSGRSSALARRSGRSTCGCGWGQVCIGILTLVPER
jgi:hypothetical protein